MDTRSGRIVDAGMVDRMADDERQYFKEMELELTAKQQRTGRVGRNDPCPCGSGKKFKNCCKI